MTELGTNILGTTAIPTLVNKGVTRRQWQQTINQIAKDRFEGDKGALEQALTKTGLRGIDQKPKWWVRNGVEDPAIELTATKISKGANALGLSDDDAKELATRWAFSRLRSPWRDHLRFANPSRFARLATLVSGKPVPVFTDPSKQLLVRVGHQLMHGWSEFHNLAIAEHLYDCWTASHENWLFLLDRGVDKQGCASTSSYLRHQKSITRYGRAMNKAYYGLINGENTACLRDLENIKVGDFLLAGAEMYRSKQLFDAINDLFFASAYATLANEEGKDSYLAEAAAKNLQSARLTFADPYESLVDELSQRGLEYVIPAIRNFADNLTK